MSFSLSFRELEDERVYAPYGQSKLGVQEVLAEIPSIHTSLYFHWHVPQQGCCTLTPPFVELEIFLCLTEASEVEMRVL